MRIFKYTVVNGKITLPSKHEIMHVAYQYGDLVVWAFVDTAYSDTSRNVYRRLTGAEVPFVETLDYYDTFIHDNGDFVEHIFISAPEGS